MIKDLAELQKLLKLCRRQGVAEINFEGTSIKFGELPREDDDEVADSQAGLDPLTGLTPEQLAFYSAPQVPDQ